jgi:YegS/Rv2252/BmrU family lipid kinase
LKKRYKIIANPISGRGNGLKSLPSIERTLQDLSLSYEISLTEKPMHAVQLAQDAAEAGFDVVVASGGDGTANEVLNGMMAARQPAGAQPAMGILCVGRGNDFAHSVGIPTDPEAGCHVLARDHRRQIDIGFVKGGDFPEGRYFGNGVGIGFDAVVGFEALKMRRLRGFLSYLVAALKTIFLYYQAPKVLIQFNGMDLEMDSLMVSIMNGRRLGGGFQMAPGAQMDDGLFDLCLASQVSRARIAALIPHFMRGTQESQSSIQTACANRISVSAIEGALPAHLDGETLCEKGSALTLEILPSQLEILYDRGGGESH